MLSCVLGVSPYFEGLVLGAGDDWLSSDDVHSLICDLVIEVL